MCVPKGWPLRNRSTVVLETPFDRKEVELYFVSYHPYVCTYEGGNNAFCVE